MKELVFKGEGNQALTNSLLVAEKFGKEHRRVMQDIRELGCSEEFRLHNFVQSSYINSQNKEMPMIIMTKDGFTLLAMGYTGDMAMKFKEEYIAAFNTMEQTLKSGGFQVPTSFREALLLAAQQQEKIEEQQKQLAEQAPKVLFANAVETSQKSCLIGELAKILRQNGLISEKRDYSRGCEKKGTCVVMAKGITSQRRNQWI